MLHKWKIFTTEILSKQSRIEGNCNALQIIFNPAGEQRQTKLGDIDTRVGQIKISSNQGHKDRRQLFFDSDLSLVPSDLDNARHLYLVLYDDKSENVVISCARIRSVKSKVLR